MKTKTQKIALIGVLSAQALALAFLENLLPALPFLPPGVKLGLSNIVTMFCAGSLGFAPAFFVTVIKSLFVFLTRGATAFFMSLGGGLLSTLAMCLMVKSVKNKSGYIGVAVVSAICHNLGQLAVSIIITKTTAMISYAPVLLISAVVMGFITGTVLKFVMPLLIKQSKYFKCL
ncbi:MAG: Gx transporter family protein [Clostridia bacterium]|nr:Gx transporter family protein [Clostridia bacterium]